MQQLRLRYNFWESISKLGKLILLMKI